MDLTSFKNYLSINLGDKATKTYVAKIKGFFRYYPEFTQENLNSYLASKVSIWCAGTFNIFYKSCRWYMKFSKIELELPKDKKEERKPRPYLKEDVIEEIITKIPVIFQDGQKIQLIFKLLFKTGLRPDELFNLQRKNILLEEFRINIVNTKTSTSRVIPFPPDFADEIRSYFNVEPEQKNAFNICEKSIGYCCQMIKQYMNISTNAYQWRHNFSHDYLKRSKNDLVALAKILGHTNLSSTQIYCDIDEKELQERYNQAFKNKRRK